MTTKVIVALPVGDGKAAGFIRTMLVLGVARSIAHQFLSPNCFVEGTSEEEREAVKDGLSNQIASRLLSGLAVVTVEHGDSPRFYSVADKLNNA